MNTWQSIEDPVERKRAYARERMRARRVADPDGEREKLRAWRQANPERVKARKRAWHKANPDKVRAMNLKKNFEMTPEEHDALFALQGHKCAVCRTDDPTGRGRGRWVTDHCHDSGRVRGILCSFCNSMLGYAKDNETTLANAIEYLKGAAA